VLNAFILLPKAQASRWMSDRIGTRVQRYRRLERRCEGVFRKDEWKVNI